MQARSFSLALIFGALLVFGAMAQAKKEKGLQLKDLPAPVQQTINANLQGGQIKRIAKEKEDGIEQYEVETMTNGKSRDLNVDVKGNLLVIESATTIDAIPAAARDSILKKTAGGKVVSVETFTKTGQAEMYEAAYVDKNGKKHEMLVKADGTAGKE